MLNEIFNLGLLWLYGIKLIKKSLLPQLLYFKNKNMIVFSSSFLSIIYVQSIVGDIPGRANISSFRSLPELVNTSRDAKYNLHNY
jgi:hypothetical protein